MLIDALADVWKCLPCLFEALKIKIGAIAIMISWFVDLRSAFGVVTGRFGDRFGRQQFAKSARGYFDLVTVATSKWDRGFSIDQLEQETVEEFTRRHKLVVLADV